MLIDCISLGAEGTIDGAYFRTYAISFDYLLENIFSGKFCFFVFFYFLGIEETEFSIWTKMFNKRSYIRGLKWRALEAIFLLYFIDSSRTLIDISVLEFNFMIYIIWRAT